MITAVLVAVLTVLCFAAAGPSLARALPPRLSVWLLTPAVILAAGSSAFVLSVVTFAWLGQLGEVAERGTWSPQALHALDPIPRQVSILAGLMLLPAAGWTARTVVGTGWALWRVRRASRDLPAGAAGVTVIDSPDLEAHTTSAGRIIVTRGLLKVLDLTERRVLFAHERSHRRHRHIWWNLTSDLAAAVNPVLRPTARALRYATERWADEDATAVADRRTVATTIAKVALLRSAARSPQAVVASATGGHVVDRVNVLLSPAPRTRVRHVGLALALMLSVLVATVAVEYTGETLFELANQPSAVSADR
jgi:hypothetical protein